MRAVFAITATVAFSIGCGSSKIDVKCGPGTVAMNGACVPAADGCGSGTMNVGGSCVPADPPLRCGQGTHEEAGVCLVDPPKDPTLDPTPWSKNVRVGSTDESASTAAIAVDSMNRIFVGLEIGGGGQFSQSGSIEVWKSDDGSTFQRVFVGDHPAMNGVSTGFDQYPSIAIDGMDRVIVLWSSVSFVDSVSTIAAAISNDGTSFDTTAVFSVGGSPYSPPSGSVQTMPSGQVAAVWSDQQSLSWAVSDPSTGHFGSTMHGSIFPHDPQSAGGVLLSAPAFDSAQHPFALVNRTLFARASGASRASTEVWPVSGGHAAFTSMLTITTHYGFSPSAALVSDHNGHIRAIFNNAVSRRIELFETRSSDGSSWSDPVHAFAVAETPTQDAPSIAADEDGGLHALWCDTRSGGWLTYSADAPPDGDFGPSVRVSEVQGLEDIAATTTALGTAIAVRGGRKYAVWIDPRAGIYFSSSPR